MVLAVLAVRFAFGTLESKGWQIVRLTCEVTAGGVAFVGGAFVLARQATRELIELLEEARWRSGGLGRSERLGGGVGATMNQCDNSRRRCAATDHAQRRCLCRLPAAQNVGHEHATSVREYAQCGR